MKKYQEIIRLKEMLEAAKIPFDFRRLKTIYDYFYGIGERYQICYPKIGENIICSVVEGAGTYGADDDLLEIMGLLTPEEKEQASVLGYLTAVEVLERIKAHWEANNEK